MVSIVAVVPVVPAVSVFCVVLVVPVVAVVLVVPMVPLVPMVPVISVVGCYGSCGFCGSYGSCGSYAVVCMVPVKGIWLHFEAPKTFPQRRLGETNAKRNQFQVYWVTIATKHRYSRYFLNGTEKTCSL